MIGMVYLSLGLEWKRKNKLLSVRKVASIPGGTVSSLVLLCCYPTILQSDVITWPGAGARRVVTRRPNRNSTRRCIPST